MPTSRRKGSSDKLTSPVDDPEVLIRARNAERRRLAKLAKNDAVVELEQHKWKVKG